MNYWLIKSEPGCYSWQQMQSDKVTEWDGVRNYQARNNMIAMRLGDLAFFYHSITGKQIVGIVKVVKEHYADPDDPSGKFCLVDFECQESLQNPVTLVQIKEDEALSNIALVKQSRLSVMPITEAEWNRITEISTQN